MDTGRAGTEHTTTTIIPQESMGTMGPTTIITQGIITAIGMIFTTTVGGTCMVMGNTGSVTGSPAMGSGVTGVVMAVEVDLRTAVAEAGLVTVADLATEVAASDMVVAMAATVTNRGASVRQLLRLVQ